MKGNICTCVNKNGRLLLNRQFISGHPRNEIHFISPAMKSNVSRISFMVDWNFVSQNFFYGGLEFRFAEFLLWWIGISFRVDFIWGLM